MGIALHEVQTNFTARSSCAGGGDSSCSLLAFGIKSNPRRCRNCAKHLICIITMWTPHPTLLLTEEGPDAQRGRALAQGHTVSQSQGGLIRCPNLVLFTHRAHCLSDAEAARKRTWGPEVGHTVDLSRARTSAGSPDSESMVLSAAPHLWAIRSLSSSSHRGGRAARSPLKGGDSPDGLLPHSGPSQGLGGPGSRSGLKLIFLLEKVLEPGAGSVGGWRLSALTRGSLGARGLSLWFQADLGLNTNSTN